MKRSLFMEDVLINKASEIEALVLATLHNWLVYCIQHNENLGKDGKYLIRRSWSKLTKDLGLFVNESRMAKICRRLKDKGLIELRPNETCQGFSFPNQDWRISLEGEALKIMHMSNISSKPTGFFYLNDEKEDAELWNNFQGGGRISRGVEEIPPELSNKLSNELNIHTDTALSHNNFEKKMSKYDEGREILELWEANGLKPLETNVMRDVVISEILGLEVMYKIPLEDFKKAVINYATVKHDQSIAYDCEWSIRSFMGKLGKNIYQQFLPEHFSINNYVKKKTNFITESVTPTEVIEKYEEKQDKINEEYERLRKEQEEQDRIYLEQQTQSTTIDSKKTTYDELNNFIKKGFSNGQS